MQIFQVGMPAGNPEYGDQFFQRIAAVFCKLLWFYCYGGIHSGE